MLHRPIDARFLSVSPCARQYGISLPPEGLRVIDLWAERNDSDSTVGPEVVAGKVKSGAELRGRSEIRCS